jgi:hypothetical protein
MTLETSPTIEKDSSAPNPIRRGFSASEWLLYFQHNRQSRVNINLSNAGSMPLANKSPLLRSLQRFQIGESGEGKHLRKFAQLVNDPVYEECIDLFLKEEQYHALVLAQIIQSMNGTLLNWHWSDIAFIGLRRMLGLKTELFILLIAEIIGKCFYKTCAHSLENTQLSDTFALIVLDEIAHLEFHCEFLHDQLKLLPPVVKRLCYYSWCLIFFSACLVFVSDHASTLKALKVQPRDFFNDCADTFYRAATKISFWDQQKP